MRSILVFLLIFALFSCARFPEEEVKRAKLEIETMYYADVPKYLPEEWGLMRDVWQKIDEAERQRDREAAMRWYNYVMEKASLFEDMLAEKKQEEEALKKQKEEERRRLLELEQQKLAEKKEFPSQPIQTLPKEEKKEVVVSRTRKKSIDDVRYKIEKRYPSFYTVREEESLEEIAELPSIYNDRYYWPLIYKFNRNQVRDPKKLYKGQILRIPRNITMEDIFKAREEAKAKTPRVLPKTAFTPEKYRKFIEELISEE